MGKIITLAVVFFLVAVSAWAQYPILAKDTDSGAWGRDEVAITSATLTTSGTLTVEGLVVNESSTLHGLTTITQLTVDTLLVNESTTLNGRLVVNASATFNNIVNFEGYTTFTLPISGTISTATIALHALTADNATSASYADLSSTATVALHALTADNATSSSWAEQTFVYDAPVDGATTVPITANWANYFRSALNEPTGFENRTSSTIAFNSATREFSITPVGALFNVWQNGLRYPQTAPSTVTLANTAGSHFVYFDAGILSQVLNPSHLELDAIIINKVWTCIVYWNATDGDDVMFADERHGGQMSGETHHLEHATIGTRYHAGLETTGYILATDSDAALTFEVSDGEVYDEDIEVVIVDGDPAIAYEQQLNGGDAEIPVLYRDDVDASWTEGVASTLPYLTAGSGRLARNNDDGDGTYSQVELGNNKWMAYTLVGTNDTEYPIKMIQGTTEYADKKTAVEEASAEVISFGDFPGQETRILFRFVMHSRSTYGGSKKAIIEERVDYRASGLNGQNTLAQDHGTLGGLGDNDHGQYLLALLDGPGGYLTIVAQVLTVALIDLTTDVTGVLPDGNVADDITLTNLTQITTRNHSDTQNQATDDHHTATVSGDITHDSTIGGTTADAHHDADQIIDDDADTKVQAEESADEDKVRMDVGGTEIVVLDNNGMGIGENAVTGTPPATPWLATNARILNITAAVGDSALCVRNRNNADTQGIDLWQDNTTGHIYLDNRYNSTGARTYFRTNTDTTPAYIAVLEPTGMVVGGNYNPNGFPAATPWDSTTARFLGLIGGDPLLFLRPAGSNTQGLDIWHDNTGGDSYFDNRYDSVAGDMFFRVKTNGTPLLVLTLDGDGTALFADDVGIGVTPAYRFDVKDSVANGFVANVFNDGGEDSSHGMIIRHGEDTGSFTGDPKFPITILDGLGGGIGWAVWTDATDLAWMVPSDERIKTGIVDSPRDSLERIARMRLRDYQMLSNPTKTITGFVADEVELCIPEAVSDVEISTTTALSMGLDVDEGTTPTIKAFAPARMIPDLVRAIQQQQGQIEALQAENAALKAREADREWRLKIIEERLGI